MADDIHLGSILSASNPNQTWDSPSKTFSLHFLSVSDSSYSLAITYADSLPIWVARATSSPSVDAAVDAAGSFHFLNGDLQLRDGTGTVLWSSNTSDRGVSHATLDDYGNLILKNGSVSLWTSFEHPTDTIVPSQNFTTKMALTSGLYSFKLKSIGNLSLMWNESINYWTQRMNSSSLNVSLKNPNIELATTGILSLYDSNLPTSVIMAYSSDYVDSDVRMRMVKLDNDGNLRIYSSKGTSDVNVRWTAVLDQCEVFGYCGNMGVCSYNDTDPICSCPSQNFDPIDPKDPRKGCSRKLDINNCSVSPAMLQMEHTRFLNYPPESNTDVYYEGIEPCRSNCLLSPTCVASSALADGSGYCYQKVEGFVSAYKSAALPSTSFVKVCGSVAPYPPPSSQDPKNSKKLHPWVVVLVILATLVALAIVESILWCCCCRKMQRFGGLSAQYALLEYASGAPVQFTFRELKRATKGFKERLGSGGFGAVYKGTVTNRTVVAVKQLEGIEQGEKQFRMEVATISSTHHLNLVRLIGFCSEGRHRLLVYEFMKNGSLDSFLFATNEGQPGKNLNWENRFNIAVGTARGITYLHEECRDCIVHCDIKPENILLDENYNAKVSDFGLAKLINPKDHRYRTLTSLLDDSEVDMEQIMRAIQVSFWCIQEQPSQRPMMGKVVQMLEGVMEIQRPPPPNAVHDISTVSMMAPSAPVSSSVSSDFQTPRARSISGMNVERLDSVLSMAWICYNVSKTSSMEGLSFGSTARQFKAILAVSIAALFG
ncbi:hypothetical protein V2J09_023670 [Rumex salicifolius]